MLMKNRIDGFTLVEMMVSAAVLAILLSIAVPELKRFSEAQQLTGSTLLLHTSMALARAEAARRQVPVLVDNGDGDWATGWRIYADLNGNGTLDEGEPVIREEAPLHADIVVSGNSPVRRYVRYVPTGMTRLVGGGFQAGTIRLCHINGEHPVRRLVISALGRARLDRDATGTC